MFRSKPKYTRHVHCLEAACNTGRGMHTPFTSVPILYCQDQSKCISNSLGGLKEKESSIRTVPYASVCLHVVLSFSRLSVALNCEYMTKRCN